MYRPRRNSNNQKQDCEFEKLADFSLVDIWRERENSTFFSQFVQRALSLDYQTKETMFNVTMDDSLYVYFPHEIRSS